VDASGVATVTTTTSSSSAVNYNNNNRQIEAAPVTAPPASMVIAIPVVRFCGYCCTLDVCSWDTQFTLISRTGSELNIMRVLWALFLTLYATPYSADIQC